MKTILLIFGVLFQVSSYAMNYSEKNTHYYATPEHIKNWIHDTLWNSFDLQPLDTQQIDLKKTDPFMWIQCYLDSSKFLEYPHYLLLAFKLANKQVLNSNTIQFICSHPKVDRDLFLEILKKRNLLIDCKIN